MQCHAMGWGLQGGPEQVTNELEHDWLAHRWQAAVDMSGTPLPLPQWVVVDLGAAHHLTSLILDWETAFASHYQIQVCSQPWPAAAQAQGELQWQTVYETRSGSGVSERHQHIVQRIDLRSAGEVVGRLVRVLILRNGAPWGASLWRVEVFGR